MVAELAAGHAGGETVVMVTHREGMWQLAALAGRGGMARRAGCCDFHFYAFDPAERRLTAAEESEAPPQAPLPRLKQRFSAAEEERRRATMGASRWCWHCRVQAEGRDPARPMCGRPFQARAQQPGPEADRSRHSGSADERVGGAP